MRVSEHTMFFNEHVLASIKVAESSRWVDELHITEANRTYRNGPKKYLFMESDNPKVRYHQLDATNLFRGRQVRPKRSFPFIERRGNTWYNEAMQRNFSCEVMDVSDNDIIVFSDLDEILDPKRIDEVIDQSRRHGIVTVGLHHTMYFFNLFSETWSGPPDFSYRVFIMTGATLRGLAVTPDQLRKLGERGDLTSSVRRIPGFSGFHHSWLGGESSALSKLTAYAHGFEDHDPEIFPRGKHPNARVVEEFIAAKRSLFGPSHRLVKRDDVELLDSVQSRRGLDLAPLFVD